jgi:hypothetical protein
MYGASSFSPPYFPKHAQVLMMKVIVRDRRMISLGDHGDGLLPQKAALMPMREEIVVES